MTEKDLQAAIVELAGYLGWLVFHPYDSRRSQPGYPDLTLCRPPRGAGECGRVIFAEIKTAVGRLRPAQRVWLAALGDCPGVETYIFRPEQWRSGDIETILRGER